ncbi:MAG: phosphate ABC transporter substrate-binding/OmpA family protein [Tabrizicola sp.]
MVGELLSVEDGHYILDTPVGRQEIPIGWVLCVGAACPIADVTIGGEVTFSGTDGNIVVQGTVVGYLDGLYQVETARMGIVAVKGDGVTCVGDGCLRILDAATAAEASAEAPVEASAEASAEAPVEAPVEAPAEPPAEAPAAAPANATPAVLPDQAKVRFAGSDTVGHGLMPFLLEDYADYLGATATLTDISETEVFVRYVGTDGSEISSLYVNSTGSGDAFDALESKSAELGMTSRPQDDEEAQRLIAAGAADLRGTDHETVIAVDSLAVITHPSNPVKALTRQQIGDMYLGVITNWSQVGGPDAPITVLSREDDSNTRGVFENAIFSGEEPTLAERVTYPGGDNPEMAAAVLADENAIGYVGFAYSEGLNRVEMASTCGITTTATPFSVKTEEYPLGRRLFLYNRPDNLPADASRFLEYVLSPEADDAIAQSNFVNFAVERLPQSPTRLAALYDGLTSKSEKRLADEFRADFIVWDRLSTTVRFATGSATLGNKEINDINRLISYLETLDEGTRVAIVGFADSVGGFDFNTTLSDRRAQSVARSIADLAGDRLRNIRFEAKAYGELVPALCNDDENGRRVNRRVEIWVLKQPA